MPTSRRRNRRGRKNRRGGGEDGSDEGRGDEGRGIGELRELPILVLGGTGENTLMSACASGIQQKFFRGGSFFILANTPLGVVRRMEGKRRPGMGVKVLRPTGRGR
jgi:hypothetical protein